MFERVVILVLVITIISFLIKWFFNNRFKRLNNLVFDIAGTNSGLPTIIYFWTEQCSQCFCLQKPALSKLKHYDQDFNLVSYNAFNEVEVAKKLNIKTVPATVVLSKMNEVRFINNGFASEQLLASQIKET